MGLDTTHNAWHGPYSSFNKWREWIAEKIGIDLKNMVGFGGETPWDNFKNHDLYPLLNHSDCDGILTPNECEKTLAGLRIIIENTKASDEDIHYMESAVRFYKGCALAIMKNEILEFN